MRTEKQRNEYSNFKTVKFRSKNMRNILHITSGDCAAEIMAKANLDGEVFVWHDVMYDGPRQPGIPTDDIINARAEFLEGLTGGGLSKTLITKTLKDQYKKIDNLEKYDKIVLWFDACLFDQSMLAHILTCLLAKKYFSVKLLCVDKFPEIVPYNGLGQLTPLQLEKLYPMRKPVTTAQFQFAKKVDAAFATQNFGILNEMAIKKDLPLPWVSNAAKRWIEEQPNSKTGLGKLETLILSAIKNEIKKPWDIFKYVAKKDSLPQYWGDSTLWQKINELADKKPSRIKINGPKKRLPQWKSNIDLNLFEIEINK